MARSKHNILMEEALKAYVTKHGHLPKVLMLGDDIWWERANVIAEDMNRTGLGTDSSVVVHHAKGCSGILCAEEKQPIPAVIEKPVDPFSL